LDEGPWQEYERRLQRLQDFVESYPGNRFVFACRYLDSGPLKVHRIVLRELEDQDIKEFIRGGN